MPHNKDIMRMYLGHTNHDQCLICGQNYKQWLWLHSWLSKLYVLCSPTYQSFWSFVQLSLHSDILSTYPNISLWSSHTSRIESMLWPISYGIEEVRYAHVYTIREHELIGCDTKSGNHYRLELGMSICF